MLSKIVLDSIDRYLFEIAAQDRLVNRRDCRAFAIVSDRQRIAGGLTRQLQAPRPRAEEDARAKFQGPDWYSRLTTKGSAKPADLSVEQLTKTAKALRGHDFTVAAAAGG